MLNFVKIFYKVQHFSIQILDLSDQFVWQLYAIVVRYRRFQQMSSLLAAKELKDWFAYIETVMAESRQLVMLIIYILMYIHIYFILRV